MLKRILGLFLVLASWSLGQITMLPPYGVAGSGTEYQYRDSGALGAGLLWHCPNDVVGFGGCTASFPALKRSGTRLEVRLADDSGLAELRAKNIFAGAANLLGFASSTALYAPSDGSLRLTNAAGTDFGLLQFGGTTSDFPALKRSSTALQVPTGFQVNGAATSGNFLRGNGTYFVSSAIQAGDLQDLNYIWTGTHDFSGAALEVPNSTSLPGTCAVGEVYVDSDASAGQRLYLCESADTWVLQTASVYNVKAFGAVGDGTTDDTSALQAAITAAGTYGVIYAPKGDYKISAMLSLLQGQVLFGDGRYLTTFLVDSSFPTSSDGIFYGVTAEPGPTFRGFSVEFIQPDSVTIGDYTQWPPAFYLANTPRCEIHDVSILRAWDGIDLTGNAGGVVIENLWMSAFHYGIQVDGAQDTIRIRGWHHWPFGLTDNQRTVFASNVVYAGQFGRADDLVISDSLTISGRGYRFYTGTGGNSNAKLTNIDFDGHNGIIMENGVVLVSNSMVTLTDTNVDPAVIMSGGHLLMSNIFFHSSNVSQELVDIDVTSGGNNQFSLYGGYLYQSSNSSDLASAIVARSTSGILFVHVQNVFFIRVPNVSFTNPVIDAQDGPGGERVIVTGNIITDKGSGTGVFVQVASANFNVVANNRFIGWTATFPANKTNGIYQDDSNMYFGSALVTASLKNNSVTFANLGAPGDGTQYYCSDCTKTTPCASGGSGALAVRINGAWDCNP